MNFFFKEKIKVYFTPDTHKFVRSLELFENISSTNDYLLKRNDGESKNGIVCLAESQTGGRGRNAKTWNSPRCGNIYFSLSWEPKHTPPFLSSLSLVTALIVKNACLASGAASELLIKWPNDVLLKGKKCAGILIETRGKQIVIGIGINLNPHETTEPNWTSLNEHEPESIDGNRLAAELLNQFSKTLPQFERDGFKPFQTEWNASHAFKNQEIERENIRGIAKDVNENGALEVITHEGAHVFLKY